LERDNNSIHKNIIREQDLKKIVEFLETIQYGSVTVIVQDGKLLQIEKSEKIRIR
jgi:hypothetical protein